jgi:hypothetical protein
MMFQLKTFSVLFLACCLCACAGGTRLLGKDGKSLEVTAKTYAKNRATHGVVLFDANWGRHWGCSGYKYARLSSLSFDRLPAEGRDDKASPDILIEEPNKIRLNNRYLQYAIIVEPGEYALSGFKLLVSRGSPMFMESRRSHLAPMGIEESGSFKVGANETVYIGHFDIDCYTMPMLWRYYWKGDFQEYLGIQKDKYPFLKLDNVVYRLFDGKAFGRPHNLGDPVEEDFETFIKKNLPSGEKTGEKSTPDTPSGQTK